MKLTHKIKKIRTGRNQPWRLILPILVVLTVGGLGAYLTFGSRAASEPTFKLFAPGWRGLGGAENKANLVHFKHIFTNGADPNATRAAAGAGSKVFAYMLGPYTVAPYVPASIMNPDNPNAGNAGGAKVLPASAYLIGNNSKKYVPYANGFKNNFLLDPGSDSARTYAREKVKDEILARGTGNQYDGVLSDSMGLAPIQSGYLNEKPLLPGTTTTWTDPVRWVSDQTGFLASKKSQLKSMGKSLIMNGLATGQLYFREPLNASPQALLGPRSAPAVDGGMAERIFREPHARSDAAFDPPSMWIQDVYMIADVESRGIDGYWWTKCWSTEKYVDTVEGKAQYTDSCKFEGGDTEGRITKARRYAVASYLLGAGSKSYFNFDADKYEGVGKGNAAEWYANDYNKATALGTQLGGFTKSGNTYKRPFSNGLAVVNPEGSAQTIDLGSARYTDFDGVVRTGNYVMPANTGNVLLKSAGGGGGGGGDTVAPTVSRTAPAAGATISGTLTATGSASDNVAVTKVELLIDGTVKGTDTTFPGVSIALDSKSIANGSRSLVLRASDAAGNTAQTTAITITVANGTPPPAPTIASFTANPNPVTAGGRSWLSWTTTGTSSCSITPDGVTNTKLFTWQTPALASAGSKTYTLDCINSASKHVTRSLTLSIKAPTAPPTKPILNASKTEILTGHSSTLSWTSAGAASCVLNPGGISTSGPTGSRVVSPTSTTSYSVTCRNSIGSTTSNPLSIAVSSTPPASASPVIATFAADPANIVEGQQTTLTWTTSNVRAGGCRLAPSPLTSTNPNGSWVTPSLTDSMSYTLTCVNSAGVSTSKSLSVIVSDKPAPDAPGADNPYDDDSWDDSSLTDDLGNTIDNGAYDDDLSGLAVLDPSNISDEEKIENIDHVEYYIEDRLIQSDDTPPFALDTTKLKNGTYTITEKTYYLDGSSSEVTRTVDIQNDTEPAVGKKDFFSGVKQKVGVGLGLLLIAALVAGYLYLRKRHILQNLPAEWTAGHHLPGNGNPPTQPLTPASLASSLGTGTVFSPTPHTIQAAPSSASQAVPEILQGSDRFGHTASKTPLAQPEPSSNNIPGPSMATQPAPYGTNTLQPSPLGAVQGSHPSATTIPVSAAHSAPSAPQHHSVSTALHTTMPHHPENQTANSSAAISNSSAAAPVISRPGSPPSHTAPQNSTTPHAQQPTQAPPPQRPHDPITPNWG